MCLWSVGSPMRSSSSVPRSLARLHLWPFALSQTFSDSLVGRDSHDYYDHSAPACSAHCPSQSPQVWGEAGRFPGRCTGTIDKRGWTSERVPASAGLKTEANRSVGLRARPSISDLTDGPIPLPWSPSSTPALRRSRCVSNYHVSSSPVTGSPFLPVPTRSPLAGRRPAHDSCCPLDAHHDTALGSVSRQSEDVRSHQCTVSN